MRVAAYIRVSSREQADSGLSLDNQKRKTTALADLQDWPLVDVVEDRAASAKNTKRVGLERILSLVRSRKIQAVVVYKLDRLVRNQRDLLDLLATFQRFGVRLVSVCEQLDTEIATGCFFIGMLGLIAEWERGVISERTSADLGQLKRNGKRFSGIAPFGFRYTESGDMAPVESEKETLRVIGELTLNGLSLRKIAAELQAQGRKPRTAKRWHPTVISQLKDSALAEIAGTERRR
jgi:site-specific DNA recombinase